jgi:hypothetical protein
MARSLFGLLILIADVWAIIRVFQSAASNIEKLLWTILILIFPIIGLAIWYFAGPGNKKI